MSKTLQELREEVAKLTGTINRTCGNLGLEPGPEALDTWNQERDAAVLRASHARQEAAQGPD